ncbi:MAG TPA: xanthine dehydrogenase family protein molybdopterin-binding subunit [Methylomirabilota bacterium]|nr:xanthine dehydrogenase family protein molybdopterin-binding subunit [Methylomirabilota bacterium]
MADTTRRTWVGKSIKRLEDPKLLTGEARYVDDVHETGMLHAAVLRSPYAHARIKRLDTTKARALPGVVAVVTGKEAAELAGPVPAFCAEPVVQHAIAQEKARFAGEAVAAVAATDRYVAEDAVDLIEVEWEPLPVVSDVETALRAGAPLVHENLGTNLVFGRTLTFGDVKGDFSRADHVVRRRLRWPRGAAVPVETAGAVARYEPMTRRMTVWANTNMYHYTAMPLAGTLKIDPNKFTIVPVHVGGSFGSKHLLSKAITIAGILAKASGRPVKFVEDRVDNLTACDSHASDRIYDAELAVTRDGRFLSLRIDVADDYGAYFQFGQTSHGNYLAQVTGPYTIGSVEITLRAVLTNKCQQMVYRGAGSEVNNWMLEVLVDTAAHELGLSPVEIRRRNFIRPEQFPYRIPTGNCYDSGNYAGVLDMALTMADLDRWRKEQARLRREGRCVGIGLAACQQRSVYSSTEFWFWYEKPGFPVTATPEGVTVQIGQTGQLTVSLSSPFWGNSPETTVAQVLAEEFGVDPGSVSVIYEDSLRALPAAGPGGSRLTVMLAGAATGAARKLREKILRIAGHLMEVSPDDLVLAEGKVSVKGVPQRALSLPDVAAHAHFFKMSLPADLETGLTASHTYDHPFTTPPSADRSDLGVFYPIMAHACHIPVVEVDVDTGRVTFLDYVAVHDCGTMMNPAALEGQIAGGIAQGIGTALYEELRYDGQGQLLTASFLDYLLPTASEVPVVRIGHQETPSPYTPYGLKGSGEGGRMVAPAAVASAVQDALRPLGVEVSELPITPDRIVRWVREARARR